MMTHPSKTSRYGFIDAIRGIAACSVMFQHSLYASGLLGNTKDLLAGIIPSFLELGETGVVAFFLVSGFVIPLSLEKTANFKLFWLHRALRIYPLYIVIFFATFAVQAGGDIHSVKAFLVNFTSHLFFVQEYVKQEDFVGGSWTLSLEVVWYIAISGLFLVSLNKKTTMLVCLSVLVSVLADLCCAFGLHVPTGRLSMLLCCVLGLVCYRRSKDELSVQTFTLFCAILVSTIAINLLAGLQLFPSSHPTSTFQSSIDSWALAAVIFFVPFFTRKSMIWAHPAGAFLGRISYSVYLLHPILLYVLLQTQIRGVPMIGITFAITIALAILTYKFIESPAIRFGHSRKTTALRDQDGADAFRTAIRPR
jgi:peptidoglycan/LPS O-acetylase OafA/YrhL